MEIKYRLTEAGEKDTPKLRAVVEHLKVFPLFRDSKARIINYQEYKELVKAKEINKLQSYWQIKENEVGLISLDHFSTYSTTWSLISSAKSDFYAGWDAHEKSLI